MRWLVVVVFIGCGDSSPSLQQVYTEATYIKASNTGAPAQFGASLALSSDGSTLAVGGEGEASGATGIDGNQRDTSAQNAGAVYVFARQGDTWAQQAYVKASNTLQSDWFGTSVALSGTGETLAVGAFGEGSLATGIDGNQTQGGVAAGAVYVFTRSGSTWAQQAYVKASNTDNQDKFGTSVALSADGMTLAVGAVGESSQATGVDGDQTTRTAREAGAVYVFTRNGSTWAQQAYVKASDTMAMEHFGSSVALSSDGSVLAVGAAGTELTLTLGKVFMFRRTGSTWAQDGVLQASNASQADHFGVVALSGDGSTLIVGASGEVASSRGINPAPNRSCDFNNPKGPGGAVYVFERADAAWNQTAYVKSANLDCGDLFGASVAISQDGQIFAAGAIFESSNSEFPDMKLSDNSSPGAGAAYLFSRSDSGWRALSYIKATNPDQGDVFGASVALTGDGGVVAVGASQEQSAATGIDGAQADNSLQQAGAAYVYQ